MNKEDFMVELAFLTFIPQRNRMLSMLVGICTFTVCHQPGTSCSVCPFVLVEKKECELLRCMTGAKFCSTSESAPGLSSFLPEQNL